MALAVLLLLAGWMAPPPLRQTIAAQRPFAFLLLGVGALLMWLHSRRSADPQSWHGAAAAAPAEAAQPAWAAVEPRAQTMEPEANALAPQVQPQPPQRVRPTQWSAAVLRAIEWRRFEALCEALFQQDGYETKSLPHGADGGVDIWLYSPPDRDRAARAVQCKNWSAGPVGVTMVREFLGVMVDAGVASGVFIATSGFTAEASAFAQRHPITLLDGTALLALIGKRGDAQQQALLAVATEGEYWRPTCANCGMKMVERMGGGSTFWGCPTFPRCKAKLYWVSEAA
jgi:restriction system protein